ncbi:MAG: M20/M25/M40 family metallo-hydrolase [Myxococcota bacterium]
MFAFLLACAHTPDAPAPAPADPAVAKLVAAARADGTAFARLSELCDEIGARPAGSVNLEKAVAWSEATFRADGLDAVRSEPVEVDHWIRGEERLTMLSPASEELAVLGLGNSVGTEGVEAPVVVVHSFDELGPHVAGKIVLFNRPMEEGTPAHMRYGTAVEYRGKGPSRAARFGAVATLVRSVTTRSLYSPHTGGTWYEADVPKIPAAAITVEDAERIDRLASRGKEVRLRLEMGARLEGPKTSHNVIAEIRGSERPDEIVLIGAHLDSWDVGTGAQDDGAGVIHVIEAMRQMERLGEPPKRTVRAVLFTNEERGLSGGKAYAAAHGDERHVVAVESDLGAGRPLSWAIGGTEAQVAWFQAAAAPLGLPVETDGGGGADIGPLEEKGTLVVGMVVDDTHYFDIHHTDADTVDKVNASDLNEGVAQLAALAWRLANAP